MKEEQIEQWMSMAMDGELSDGQLKQLEDHLGHKIQLDARYEKWKSFGPLLNSTIPASEVSPSQAAAEVLERIHADEIRPSSFWAMYSKWITSCAIFLLLVGVASWLTFGATSPQLAEVESVETDVPGATTMIYEDEENELVVIWLLSEQVEVDHAGS